jgi:hypothetical protein
MLVPELDIKRERRATASVRFYYSPDPWPNKHGPKSRMSHLVCDSLAAKGEKGLGKFKSKKLAELFLRIVRAEYIRKGDITDLLS